MISNGRDIIRAGYAAGRPVKAIADECSSTPGSVRVIARKMGIRHRRMVHLAVPPERKYDYRVLRSLGKFSAPEAAAILGVELPR